MNLQLSSLFPSPNKSLSFKIVSLISLNSFFKNLKHTEQYIKRTKLEVVKAFVWCVCVIYVVCNDIYDIYSVQ